MIKSFSNITSESFNLFNKSSRLKLTAISLLQVLNSLLDIVAISMMGLIGALSITGVQSKLPETGIQDLLRLLNLDDKSIQFQVTVLASITLIIFIVRTCFSILLLINAYKFIAVENANLSSRIVDRIVKSNLLKMQARTTQKTLQIVNDGVSAITFGIIGSVVNIMSDFVLLTMLIIGLVFFNPLIAFQSFLLFGSIGGILYLLLNKKASELGKIQMLLRNNVNERLVEILISYRELHVRNRNYFYINHDKQDRIKLAEADSVSNFIPNIGKYVIEATLIIGTFIISATQFLTADSSKAISVIAIFVASGVRIAPAVLRIQQSLLKLKNSIPIARETLDLFSDLNISFEPITNDVQLILDSKLFVPNVHISNLRFSYPGSNTFIFNNFNLKIEAGELVALVGKSGSGKTTLVDLILGLLEPSDGTIAISGVSPKYSITSWPGLIGYVPQDVAIFNTTILQNIALGFDLDEVDIDTVWETIKQAQLMEFVNSLPNGLFTKIGERGNSISGGQKQRLGIARALYTKPKLIVFDEATSALDSGTELSISNEFKLLKNQATLIVIAHRLSTIRSADKVIYLDAGFILAQGTFDFVRSQVPDFDIQSKIIQN